MIAARPLSDLKSDQKGAVMLTGLFMSCFLIGALWFIIGIGDTIVFRDRMQEATDHGAFTSSALNAKGMNFISLCNLVLLAAVAVHIILGLIHDITLVICLIPPFVGCGVWQSARQVYTGYFRVLKPAAKAIHTAEVVASFTYPVLAFAEGFQVGRSYGGGRGAGPVTVLPFSRTLVPLGTDYVADYRKLQIDRFKRRGLLPVSWRPMALLCEKIGKTGVDVLLVRAFGVSRNGISGLVLSGVKTLIGWAVEGRYCNDGTTPGGDAVKKRLEDKLKKAGVGDEGGEKEKVKTDGDQGNGKVDLTKKQDGEKVDLTKKANPAGAVDPGFDPFWGSEGPLVVMGSAHNGNNFFQTKAINVSPWMTDASESRVGIARGPQRGMQKYETQQRPSGYFAQSEFYLDCEQVWDDISCNEDDNATFQIKWRARLRKFNLSKFESFLIKAGSAVFPSNAQLKDLSTSAPLDGEGSVSIDKIQPFLDLVPGINSDAFDPAPGGVP